MAAMLFWLTVGAIFYTYAGYPLLLTLLASLTTRPPRYSPTFPPVTLLIPAHNEEAVIAEKLENSLMLNYPKDKLQILVAVDGAEDRTAEIVRTFDNNGVELCYSPRRLGKMAAINHALPSVRGEIVVFSDANNIYAPDVIQELVTPLADSVVGGVSGSKSIKRGDGVLGESEGLYWKYEAFIKKQETRLGCCTSVLGEVFAIRRSLIELCPAEIINDDFYMAMRLMRRGYRIVYAPKACSLERISPSAQDEIARRARIVAGRYQAMARFLTLMPWPRPVVCGQIISHKFLRPLVPLFMAAALFANLAAVFWPSSATEASLFHLSQPWNWILLALQGIFYSLAWFGNRMNRNNLFGNVLYLPAFLLNSNLAAAIGLYRFITGSQTPLWQRAQRREII